MLDADWKEWYDYKNSPVQSECGVLPWIKEGLIMAKHRVYAMSFASVYPLYISKAEKKGRTKNVCFGEAFNRTYFSFVLIDRATFSKTYCIKPKKTPNKIVLSVENSGPGIGPPKKEETNKPVHQTTQ